MNCLYTRVKMCGMTRVEDVSYAVSLGVDAIGLIFYPSSPRYVSLEKAADLLRQLPLFVEAVAVLVNPEIDWVREIVTRLPIRLLQFHGDESPEFCEQFDMPYIKAIPVQTSHQIHQAVFEHRRAKALLLDTPSLTQKGGSGTVFDWNIIPSDLSVPYILAGGLNEHNIQHAIEKNHPFAVDLNSGVESAPGIKDHLKMNQLMMVIRSINR